ncbi:class I SAM-dependent methyltransferase [Paenibacillus nicotianae]|uniref:Class I SAM-dependent methyltransferase n=1 Tax=Paenibacillus nicotianae TaxID=1526551 RepID=A0ABW4USJ9_9BACL
MTNSTTSMSWNDPIAEQYTERIHRKIPGYEYLYRLTEHLLHTQSQTSTEYYYSSASTEEKRVLIIGAGGGQEIVTLGAEHPEWRFTAIDLSEQMLNIAKQRVKQQGITASIEWIQGTVDDIPTHSSVTYDAATCLLVLHFIKERDQKLELLRKIAQHMPKGAPICIACITGKPQSPAFLWQMKAWKQHMLNQQIPIDEWQAFADSIGQQSFPISSIEVEQLLKKSGWTTITSYFGSFLIQAWCAIKA